LLKVGRAAALRFLQKKLDGGPDEATVAAAHKEAEDALEPTCSEYDGSEEYCVLSYFLESFFLLQPIF
jgi:hypothetical protein